MCLKLYECKYWIKVFYVSLKLYEFNITEEFYVCLKLCECSLAEEFYVCLDLH